MRLYGSIESFYKNVCGCDIDKTAKLLNLKSSTVEECLNKTDDVFNVYRLPSMDYELHTMVKVADVRERRK